MYSNTLYSGEQLKKLIPQREPIVMVDAFYRATSDTCCTGLTVTPANIFCNNGYFETSGLIEHVAQSASAFMGYEALQDGRTPSIGYIGEIKKLKTYKSVRIGDHLHTTITIRNQVLNVTLIDAEVQTEDSSLVATCQMKISMEE